MWPGVRWLYAVEAILEEADIMRLPRSWGRKSFSEGGCGWHTTVSAMI